MVDNILFYYERSNHYDLSVGRSWYPAARLECAALAERYHMGLERVVYAVAALSPQLKWESNIAAARLVLEGQYTKTGAYSSNVEKAVHILHDESDWQRWLKGNKVESFAKNILGNPEVVTVDTWAWRVWSGSKLNAKPRGLDKLYWQIADDYREAAAALRLEPRQLQAITWVNIRRLATGKAAPGQLSLDI